MAVRISRWWHAFIAVVVVVSLVIQLVLLFTGGADANSGQGAVAGAGVRIWRLFSYFTIESNLFVLAASLVLAARPFFDGPVWRVVRLDALLGILITGVVYDLVLAPQVHLTGWALAATIGFHYVSPWMFVVGWLVLGPRYGMSWATVAGAFVWPVIWLVYIFAQGAFTHWYPYPFLDVTRIGLGSALRNAVLVVLIAVVFAVLARLADRRVPALLRERKTVDSSVPAN
ncbi:Pr6Pr family membrane protein [Amycolatopsis sp.]|uniref:Pr6Pr family membrane protein n=1 Tax=Amycolatopsis sp. TaxID=37632 RepID=UPI002B9F516E|nr:Pr6Pr family membrane protein [Amycolatopsis sp.]HVV12201.1 Pr6Pr family membrane protein [Amycolatopsis sp.]